MTNIKYNEWDVAKETFTRCKQENILFREEGTLKEHHTAEHLVSESSVDTFLYSSPGSRKRWCFIFFARPVSPTPEVGGQVTVIQA